MQQRRKDLAQMAGSVALPLVGYAVAGIRGTGVAVGLIALLSLGRLIGLLFWDVAATTPASHGRGGRAPRAARADRLEEWLAGHPETMKLLSTVVVPVCLSLVTAAGAILWSGRK